MRQLLPTPVDEVDLYDAYRPADPRAPFVRLNMIMSADGSATDPQGRAGGLAGEGDKAVYRTLRALADAVLVGAGTVRQEGYRPHRLRPELAQRRRADGRDHPAAIVVVSRSLDLDFDAPLFTEAKTPTVVLTCEAAPPQRRAAATRTGRVLIAGNDDVDLTAGLAALRAELGMAHLLAEGGPTLNAQMFTSGLIDELCLTLAPQLVSDIGLRIVHGRLPHQRLRLTGLCEQDGELYLRYGLTAAGAAGP